MIHDRLMRISARLLVRDRLMRAFIGLLCAGLIFVVAAAGRPFDRRTPPRVAADMNALPPRFVIDIGELAVHLRGKPQTEVDDQLHDWAVYGTLARLGVDEDDLGKATFKTVPVRLPYLEQAFLFDYGRGRRALLGDEQALLFVDAGDPDPTATLGRLADKVRMETGEIPKQFRVLAIAPNLSTNTIQVERRPDVDGSTMFGPDYGYVEAKADGLDAFRAWLDAVDDVTYAGVREGVLYLGGRRFAKTRTKTVTLEDVAALLQAQNDLAARRERLEAQPRRTQEAGSVDAPGFSLDPHWNHDTLIPALGMLATDPCALVDEAIELHEASKGAASDAFTAEQSDASDLAVFVKDHYPAKAERDTACRAFHDVHGAELRALATAVRRASMEPESARRAHAVDVAMQPFWRIEHDVAEHADEASMLSLGLLRLVEARHQVQCARYDGPLAGTRVGMNLFYTDLLAKLWQGVDHHLSSPNVYVPGFLSKPRMRLEASWAAEWARLPSTRIWFGPKPDGYARSSSGDAVWFAHIATRVFAAGSNPTEPGKEEPPAEASRRSLTWWDRHYEAVADHEQQYHVQNQIQKWSLITGWWRKELHYLGAVGVDRSQRFDRWYDRERAQLRYQHDLALRPESDWVTGTECLSLLSSYPYEPLGPGSFQTTTGGVSLGNRAAVKAAPEIVAHRPWALRQVVQEAPLGPWKTAQLRPIYDARGKVVLDVAASTRTRIGAVDLGLRRVDVRYARMGDRASKITLGSDKGLLGSMVARREGGYVGLRWNPSAWHTSVVESTPRAPDPEGPLARVLRALKEGDHAQALRALSKEAGGDPARLRAAFNELKEAAVLDAELRFPAGEGRAASQSYGAAEVSGRLPPNARMRQALADIQRGQVKRGLDRLETLTPAERALLVDASTGKPELAELRALMEAQQQGRFTVFGKSAHEVRLGHHGSELRTVLELERVPNRALLTAEMRVELAQKQGEDVLVYIEGFHFNAADFEASPHGMLAELSRSPNVSWAVVENMGGKFKPGVIIENGHRFERMPMLAQDGAPTISLANLNGASRIVLIRNCDTDDNGVVSNEERVACNAA